MFQNTFLSEHFWVDASDSNITGNLSKLIRLFQSLEIIYIIALPTHVCQDMSVKQSVCPDSNTTIYMQTWESQNVFYLSPNHHIMLLTFHQM